MSCFTGINLAKCLTSYIQSYFSCSKYRCLSYSGSNLIFVM